MYFFEFGGDEAMKFFCFVFDVLEYCQRISLENNIVDWKVKFCFDEVVGSDCYKVCYEFKAWDGWFFEGSIAVFIKDKGVVYLVIVVIVQF